MKLTVKDTEWLFGASCSTDVDEADLAERLNLGHIVEPVRDGDDIILSFADGTAHVLTFQDEDVTDGETTAWNFSDEGGDWYLKVVKR